MTSTSGTGKPSTPDPRENRPGYKLIYTKTIRYKSGKVIHASSYGLQAFAIWVPA